MPDRVARVQQLLAKSSRSIRRPESQEEQQRRAFEYYDFNATPGVPLEQSPQARAIRDIRRVSSWYGWGGPEVQRALDAVGASALHDLSADQLLDLHARMLKFEQCAQDGCDPPDAPPAR